MHPFRRIAALSLAAILIAGCEMGGERVPLPFRNVIADVDLSLPAGTIAVGCGDGSFVGESCFDPPVTPIGEVRSLNIDGHDIAIADTRLVGGMLRTKVYGEFEFSVSRFDPSSGKSFDILVTERQIKKLEGLVGPAPVESPALADAALPPLPPARDSRLLTDGIYVAALGDQESYMRFWQDGDVAEVLVAKPGNQQEMSRRLVRGGSGHGSWQHWNGTELHIDTIVEGKSYKYVGRIEPGGEKLILTRSDGVAQRYAEFDFKQIGDLP